MKVPVYTPGDGAGGGAPNAWTVGDKALWLGQADLATAATCGDFAGDFTTGVQFRTMRPATCAGVRAFVHWGGGGTKSVKCSLWDVSGVPAQLDTKTLTNLSSDTRHDFLFSATHALDPTKLYTVTAYITDGSYETRFVDFAAIVAPFMAGPNCMIVVAGVHDAGDVCPATTAAVSPLQPLFA